MKPDRTRPPAPRWWAGIPRSRIARPLLRARMPARVQALPPDEWPGDASVADDIYAGRYAMGGRTVTVVGRPLFPQARALEREAPDWSEALASFEWLRDLAAADTPLARANAQALAVDWIAEFGEATSSSHWQPALAARRLGHWLTHWTMLTQGTSHAIHDGLRGSVARHARYLRLVERAVRDPVGRADVALSLALHHVATGAPERAAWSGADTRGLREALAVRPRQAVRLLSRLAQARAAAGDAWLPELDALGRGIAEDLTRWRLAPGRIAGTRGPVPGPAVRAAFDAFGGEVSHEARLDDVVLVLDGAPDGGVQACGAFELADRAGPLVVSCGASPGGPPELAAALAGHEALSLLAAEVETSQAIAPSEPVEARELSDGHLRSLVTPLRGRADAVHRRTLRLERVEGDAALNGEDEIAGAAAGTALRARFHLAPGTEAKLAGPGRVDLKRADSVWTFLCFDAEPSLDETAIFDAGMQRSTQIVLEGAAQGDAPTQWRWTFMRAA